MQRREALGWLGGMMLTPLLDSLPSEERWRHGRALHERVAEQGAGGRGLPVASLAMVTALADTILPRTDTPGALDVGVPAFVDLLVADWYPERETRELVAGLEALDARCRAEQGKSFAELAEEGRRSFLGGVDGKPGNAGTPEATYRRVKDAIVYGFLTSKQIAEMQRTLPIMLDRFEGCIPMGGGS